MNSKKLQRSLEAAVALQNAGQFDEAERYYAQVRRSAPKLFDGWYLSGTLAFQRGGHLEEAVDYLTRALRLSAGSSRCKLFLGMALADLGRYAEAEKPLRSALEKHPNHPEAWENLADTLSALGRPTEAADCLRRVLADQPDRADIRERLSAGLGVEARLGATVAP
jgi:tetratricopeptide (TPR) repeat protein